MTADAEIDTETIDTNTIDTGTIDEEIAAWIDAVTPVPVTGPITTVKDRPWSYVATVPTGDGRLWFKANRGGTRYEAGLLDALSRWVPDDVLAPLAIDPVRGWSLQPDGGAVLRESDPPLDAAAWELVLVRHAGLQRRLASRVPDMLALGVPDHRPQALMAQFDRLPVPDAVAELRPRWANLCDALAASAVPASIDHDDLHDGNVFTSGKWFDWGDSSVAHPFAVLLIALRVAAQAYPDPVVLRRMRDAYLEVWSDVADIATLRAEADIARRLGKIGRALSWERSLSDDAARAEYGDAISGWLELLLEED
jgi:hypothetical protein